MSLIIIRPQPLIGELTRVQLEGHDWLGSDILRYTALVHSECPQEHGMPIVQIHKHLDNYFMLMLIAEQFCDATGGITM